MEKRLTNLLRGVCEVKARAGQTTSQPRLVEQEPRVFVVQGRVLELHWRVWYSKPWMTGHPKPAVDILQTKG